MRPTRPLLAAGACLLLLAPLTACGGDDGDDDASSTTRAEPTTTTTGDGTTTTDTSGGDSGDRSGSQQVSPDPSQPLTLGVGDKVSLVLDSNPTTGYSWQITVADEAVARVASDNYLPPRSDAMGASGKQAVEIEGVGAGETTVEAVYVRPFEPDSPAQTETWTVQVSG